MCNSNFLPRVATPSLNIPFFQMILNSIFDKKISPEKKCHFVFLKIVENEKFTFRRQK